VKKLSATPSFKRCLKKLGDDALEEIFTAMNLAAAVFGQPHLHSGRGIREILPDLYECRAGRSLRLMFSLDDDTLIFEYAGSHEQVRAWWKKR
jgi:mRNA-degrading endonuclease YafQ of YafQ-DinJ toxin-antitoxin module